MPRPTMRQILAKQERDAAYERAREASSDWLAQNYPAPPPPKPVRLSLEDMRSAADWAQFKRFEAMDEHNETPDPLGKTGHYEPRSIHDPVPPSKFRVERPRPRKPMERNDRYCELPVDRRKRQTLHVVDDAGRDVVTIKLNPFSQKLGWKKSS